MNSTMISTGTQTPLYTSSKLNLSTQSSFLDPCTHLRFSTHFPKSTFPPKTQSKSIRTTPVKAAAAATAIPDSIYVDTQSFYELLGISESGTLSEIKKAYKQLARKYHPDVSPPDRTEEYTKRFLQVQEAYETLSDPETRALYDRDMCRGLGLSTIFSARKRTGQDFADRSEWEDRWQSQLSDLIKKSNNSTENMSWGARMRTQRSCSS
ncbi:chaperone protein DNAj, putative [Ricinus communis]|uniref:Chaperone protein DNAj, putative n=1 Tax=Ricinus communis TaxID=3988 RepID=B9SYM1_RICCO|nr:chaperone protein DNAj, putative [Ricinus communis]|eukprot:XP_002531090.1 chaperone protein dnaJ 20, chloroplastic [Ricinus communis]